MKRVLLFVITNLAIVFILSITLRLLGIDRILDANDSGINFNSLLSLAIVMGFGGSLISLMISKWSAKRITGARVIEETKDLTEQWLIKTIQHQTKIAGIGMPEVAIFETPEINAFATGMNRNNALIAVSSGLLKNMSRDEIEAVLAHEVSHVANGDMVTLALIQGVVNTFVIFLSRVLGHTVDRIIFKNERGHGPAFWITSIVAQMLLGVLASMIVMWFSRQREFRADAGGAKLAGRDKMIAALECLKRQHEPSQLPEKIAAFGISGKTGIGNLFMSHPPLESRILALREMP